MFVLGWRTRGDDGRPSHRKQTSKFLHSDIWQWIVITLIIIDAALVLADIFIIFQYCDDEDHKPHSVEKAEEGMRYASVAILVFFIIEWLVEVRQYVSDS